MPGDETTSFMRWVCVGLQRSFALGITVIVFYEVGIVGFVPLLIWAMIESAFVTYFYLEEKKFLEEIVCIVKIDK